MDTSFMNHVVMTVIGLIFATMIYFVVVGTIYLMVFVAILAMLGALSLICRDEASVMWRRAGKVGVFLGLLLFFGGIGEFIWTSAVAGNLYTSADYVFGYLPFWPITQGEIDLTFGSERGARLNRATLWTVNLVWSVITAFVWGGSALSYLALYRKKRAVAASGSLR